MADLNHNGIDDALEEREYKAHAVNAKFVQQLSYGIGAAMVFGLVSVVGVLLKDAAISAVTTGGIAAATAPILGLVALGAVGVGLLYLSAKFLSENTIRDQELQAKQISSATRGVAPVVQPTVEPTVGQFPDAASKAEQQTNDNTPSTIIGNERELASTVTQGAQAARAA